ncbi:hypothetical protein G3I62_27580 [Streptomyces sp. SID14446]|uniref:hypothetical protein n=1 Tax=Streptomyces sp. SID14446 TaxID=2706072 RepID=UPI0013B69D51|nr:hypothetical protein [Streptomyces sp. SID14446]NEB32807.1 hypothetical protein [Streptomyces sp. SID14446]
MAEPDWHKRYEDLAATFGHLSDVVNEGFVAERGGEPWHTLALAASTASASEALTAALDWEWSLYTPQEAAAVLAALQVTMAQSRANLRNLAVAVIEIADRGDLDLQASGAGSASIADTLQELGREAKRQEATESRLAAAIRALETAPSNLQLPRTVHENMVAISGLLGTGAELLPLEADSHKPDAIREGCGCGIQIRTPDELYYFDHDGLEWSLLPESAGNTDANGVRTWDSTDAIGLGPLDTLAHPEQIAQTIRRALQQTA